MKTRKAQAKTPNEHNIKAQIAGLQKIKPKVRHRTIFVYDHWEAIDDHWEAIDAQARVLEKRMSDSQAEAYFRDHPQNVQDATRDAILWLEGKYTDYPDLVDSWRELVVK